MTMRPGYKTLLKENFLGSILKPQRNEGGTLEKSGKKNLYLFSTMDLYCWYL